MTTPSAAIAAIRAAIPPNVYRQSKEECELWLEVFHRTMLDFESKDPKIARSARAYLRSGRLGEQAAQMGVSPSYAEETVRAAGHRRGGVEERRVT